MGETWVYPNRLYVRAKNNEIDHIHALSKSSPEFLHIFWAPVRFKRQYKMQILKLF